MCSFMKNSNNLRVALFAIKGALVTTLILLGGISYALNSSQISVENSSGPYFYSDDGNCGSSREVPRAAYVVINVSNTSGATLNNVVVKLTGMTNTSSGFKLLSFTDDSTYVIPQILNNDTRGAFFYI